MALLETSLLVCCPRPTLLETSPLVCHPGRPSAVAGVATPTDLAEVTSSADFAEVASSADLAGVASLADLAENVTVGVASLADLLVLSPLVWRSMRSVMSRVVLCVIMMTIFMMDNWTL